MIAAYCLGCGNRLYLGRRPWVGQPVYCDRCGADLEVTQLNPLMLDWTDELVAADWGEELDAESVSA